MSAPPQTLILAVAPVKVILLAEGGRHGADLDGSPLQWPHVRALAVVMPDRFAELNAADPDGAAGKLLALCTMLEAVIARRRGDTSRITWQAVPLPDPDTIDPEHVWSLVETTGPDAGELLPYLERRKIELEALGDLQRIARTVVTTWHLAKCWDCTPVLPQPFTANAAARAWATEHHAATGHTVEVLVEKAAT